MKTLQNLLRRLKAKANANSEQNDSGSKIVSDMVRGETQVFFFIKKGNKETKGEFFFFFLLLSLSIVMKKACGVYFKNIFLDRCNPLAESVHTRTMCADYLKVGRCGETSCGSV